MIDTVRHVVANGTVVREGRAGTGAWQPLDERPTAEVLRQLPAELDTGLAPPGLRLFREAGGVAQVVQEVGPRIARLAWALTEGQARTNPTHYLVAQPWMVVASLWKDGILVGARLFYRPRPLYGLDDVLFHSNLANVNCLGYHNNAVGWICFYPDKVNTAAMGWAERLARILERASGAEAYSENNMMGIDGPGIYRARFPKRAWAHRPAAWETHSAKYGTRIWAGKTSLIPVLVGGIDDQAAHQPGGVPLTLRMALDGATPWHYHLPAEPSPPARLARGGAPEAGTAFTQAYAKACQTRGNG